MIRPARFKNPPKGDRPAPFWAWNAKLEEGELRRQIRDMKKLGYGGFYMHSRIGLETPYMSDEWMQAVEVCLDEAEAQDMEAWFYDEDKWPSGFAGGEIPRLGDAMVCKLIRAEWTGEPRQASEWIAARERTLGVYRVTWDRSRRLLESRRLDESGEVDETPGQPPAGGHTSGFLRIYYSLAEKSDWYNGESYVDLLNPEVTQAFIRSTYDKYDRLFSGRAGEHAPGFFTDEPNVGRWPHHAPWTPGLERDCLAWWGVDLLPHLPLLFFDGDGDSAVRYAYWRTVMKRFVESFSEPLGRWCEERGWRLTGHYLVEDDIVNQTVSSGAVMPHYFHMQMPGIDHLGNNVDFPLAKKQVSSAIHQTGKPKALSELFGVMGQQASFRDMKRIADFHFALGVTYMNPHLSAYSLAGERKRDFPPSFGKHQPYWPHIGYFNDYMARCSYLLRQGRYRCETLLLHPVPSAWALTACPMNPNPDGEAEHSGIYWWNTNSRNDHVMGWQKGLEEVLESLLDRQIAFDMGDDYVMEHRAEIRDDGRLWIGQAAYRVVIMPPSLNWSGAMYRLLSAWTEGGGRLIMAQPLPRMIDGMPDESAWRRLAESPNVMVADGAAELCRAADREIDWDVKVRNAQGEALQGVYSHVRETETGKIWFFSHTRMDAASSANITLRARQPVYAADLAGGDVRPFSTMETSIGERTFDYVFEPGESLMLMETGVYPDRPAESAAPEAALPCPIPLPEQFEFARLEDNLLPLDYCDAWLDGESLGSRVPIHQVRERMHERAGIGDLSQIQPWVLFETVEPKPVDVRMAFRFLAADLPDRLAVVVESGPLFDIFVNGVPVEDSGSGQLWESGFRKTEITPCIRQGINEIIVQGKFRWGMEIEAILLSGSFAVRECPPGEEGAATSRYALCAEPRLLRRGSWTGQGYPFYAGTMRYAFDFDVPDQETTGKAWTLNLSDSAANMMITHVNGSRAGIAAWAPWSFDLGGLLRPGRNRIELDVIGTLHNALGPVHHTQTGREDVWLFIDEEQWTDDYRLIPYGL